MPRILVIDYDSENIEQMKRVLQAQGYEVLTTVTGQAGIAMAQLQRPSLVLLDIDLPDIDGYEVCRALRATPSTAKVPILIHSARAAVVDKVAGLKAGANDYIVKPAAAAELVARIEAALGSIEQSVAHVVAVWGCKGGVGATTVASNLAVALRLKTGKRVILVDGSVKGGTIGVMFNLPPEHTIADLLPHLDSLDSELLSSVLAKHSSGVRILLSAPWRMDGQGLQPAQLERIISWLRDASDYIVVDTAPSLDESTMTVLHLADQVVVLLTPEMTSLHNARVFLKIVQSAGLGPEKLILVANRSPIKGGIALKDMERALQNKVSLQIPSDEALVTYSINRGIPLVASHQRSAVAQSLYQLAEATIAKGGRKGGIGKKRASP